MKKRLDTILVEKGFFTAREKAKAAIMAGEVKVDDIQVDKAGTMLEESCCFTVATPKFPYVSRGGLKLEKAIKQFNLTLTDAVILDIGSSTGGFVDCALQNGAAKIYAVDVGYGQLDWKLRSDTRVVVKEKTNARYLTPEDIPDIVDYVTIDVSFISLTKILPAVADILKERGQVVALIKPQFEAGRDKIGKKGVVREPAVHKEVIAKIIDFLPQAGLRLSNLTYSPITGPEGNIEYLMLCSKENTVGVSMNIDELVNNAWQSLK